MNIHWTHGAIQSLESQMAHIEQDSPKAARDVGDRTYHQISQLAQFPELGRVGRHLGTRELVIRRTPFVVVYRVLHDLARVEIVRVLHARQPWSAAKS